MQNKFTLGIFALLPTLFLGCGQQNRKPSQEVEKTGQEPTAKEVIVVKNPLNIVRDSLVGTWAKPCDSGMRTAIIVDARIFAKTYLFYADKDCTQAKYSLQFGGEYRLEPSDAKEDTHIFDGALQFAVMKVYDPADAADFNRTQLFGYTDWDTTTAKNIIDKGFKSNLINPRQIKASLLFSRFHSEGDKMWLADFAVEKEKRALEVTSEDGYRKLK